MKLCLALLALIVPGAYGQSVEIVSPNHAYTFAYGDAILHQIERDHLTNEMIARVTFSNYPYAGDPEPRCDETFDFVFPGLHFDAARNDFVTRTGRQVRFRSPRYTPILHTPVTSSSRTRKSFCLNAAVRSPPY
ncbi:MAG: hypothetical protein DMF14_13030 [Verrucomicrobia bacterium]|nr:MAG: hypothetical protein DMF14_13030 [Verrucomicrobiota bacterium]